jgi:predicted dithiol-disulfide oxidoreductase (DUF899 family)
MLETRKALLVKETEFTRLREGISRDRRALPCITLTAAALIAAGAAFAQEAT